MPIEIVSCEQGTEEWHMARLGIVTMSRVQCLLVKGRDASGFGADALSYMFELMGERFTGEAAGSFAGNQHTQRGHEHEPIARAAYEERTGAQVHETGIMLNHGVGYSPDGLVDNNGLIEIKSKLPKKLLEALYANEVPGEHMGQIQGGLWVSEREYLDFIAYFPGIPIFVKRVFRDEKVISNIAEAVSRFHEEMARREAVITENSLEGM